MEQVPRHDQHLFSSLPGVDSNSATDLPVNWMSVRLVTPGTNKYMVTWMIGEHKHILEHCRKKYQVHEPYCIVLVGKAPAACLASTPDYVLGNVP
jgi:hypothetical protein